MGVEIQTQEIQPKTISVEYLVTDSITNETGTSSLIGLLDRRIMIRYIIENLNV